MGWRKALYRRVGDFLEGPHVKARGKNLAFNEVICVEKEKLRSKMTQEKLAWN